jgi:opacity protein-like surface antigen
MRLFKSFMWMCLTLTTVVPLQGQLEIGGVIDFNIAGLNVQPGGTGERYSSYLGLGAGVVVDYLLFENLDLHALPMFLQKGGKISEDDFTVKYKISYLNFPVMIRYTIPLDGMFSPYVMAGPNAGIRGKARLVDRGQIRQDETEEIRIFDFGVGFGGGVKVPLENKQVFAETRYVIGLVNVNRNADESTVKNRGLQILFGITFPIGS